MSVEEAGHASAPAVVDELVHDFEVTVDDVYAVRAARAADGEPWEIRSAGLDVVEQPIVCDARYPQVRDAVEQLARLLAEKDTRERAVVGTQQAIARFCGELAQHDDAETVEKGRS